MTLDPKSLRQHRIQLIVVYALIGIVIAHIARILWVAHRVGWNVYWQSLQITWPYVLGTSLAVLLMAGIFACVERARWKRELRAAGHCRRSEYDRKGIPPTAPCPECGTAPVNV